MFFNQRDEIGGGIAREGRFREMWILADKVFRRAMDIGEVAAPAARDQDLFARVLRAFKHRDAFATLAGFDGTHQPCCAATEDECIEFVNHGAITCRTG